MPEHFVGQRAAHHPPTALAALVFPPACEAILLGGGHEGLDDGALVGAVIANAVIEALPLHVRVEEALEDRVRRRRRAAARAERTKPRELNSRRACVFGPAARASHVGEEARSTSAALLSIQDMHMLGELTVVAD